MQAALDPGAAAVCLEGIRFQHALTIDPLHFQLIQSTFDPESGAFAIHSRVDEDPNGWVVHTTGRRGPAPTEAPAADLKAIRERLKPGDSAERVYKKLWERGYHYGEAFRACQRWWLGSGELLAEISAPEAVRAQQATHIAHPALLDACVHATLLLTPGNETCIPVGIDRIVIHRRISDERVWVHARMLETDGTSATSRFSVYDDAGQLLAEFEGLQVQAVSRAQPRRVHDGLLYEPIWDVLPEIAAAPAVPNRQWLILAVEDPMAGELERRLRARGETVRRAETLALSDLADAPVTTHVVCLSQKDRDAAGSDALHEWVKGTSRVTALFGSLSRRPPSQAVRCWVVTRGATGVSGGRIDAAQALTWGVGRVAINECHDLGVRMVDLPGDTIAADLDELTLRLCADEGEEELAIRSGKSHAFRFTRLPSASLGTGIARRVRANEVSWNLRLEGADLKSAQLVELGEEAPKANEVSIGVDAMSFAGAGGTKDQRHSIVAGRVARLGPGVAGLERGDRVVALGAGTLGSFARVTRASVCKVPASISAETVAALEPWLTAKYALEEIVKIVEIVHAGASTRILVVGSGNAREIAIARMAKDAGADVAVAFQSPAEDADAVVKDVARAPSPTSARFGEWVQKWTQSRGVDVMISSGDVELPRHVPAALRPGGRFLELGGGAGTSNRAGVQLHQFPANTSLVRIDALAVLASDPALASRLLGELLKVMENKKVPALGALELPPEELVARLPALATSGSKPVVMTVSDKTIRVTASDSSLFRANGTYLITGGLGGFGLATAKWMVENGARCLVLLGRQGAVTDEAKQAVAHLQMSGAKVVVEKCDVGDRAQLGAVLERVRQKCPPLKGVYHAATSFDHWNIPDLTAERLEAGIRAKVAGAWNLHELTLNDPLEQFVLFSSATSILGVPGLAVYTAANVFLDTLARARVEQGLTGLAVGFGAVGDAGYLTRSESAARAMQHQGFRSMQTATLLATVRDLVSSGHVQVAVAEADWRQTVQFVPTLATSPRFAPLRSAQADGADSETLRERLREAPKDKRSELASSYLRTWLTTALRAQPDAIDTHTPIDRLGFDSLLAAELTARVKKDLEINLPAMELLAGPTIEQLTTRVLALVDGAPAAGSTSMSGGSDWDRDAVLDESIRATSPYTPPADGPRDVFLTGASGFVGAFLLRELLQHPRLRIHCLVRPRAEIGGAERLKANLIAHGLGSAWDGDRVFVVPGDLDRDHLGLEAEEYERLAAKIDLVIHSGALVNFALDYASLAPSNVAGTREVIRFAAHKKTKPLHHVSSAYVFSSPPSPDVSSADESTELEAWGRPALGYTQTKHVADRLAQAARTRGVPTNIYRPGFVLGDSQSGSANMRDLVTSSIRLIAQFGVVPESDPGLAVAPVDYVCRAIVDTALSSQPLNRNLHILDREVMQLDDIGEALTAHGYSVKALPPAEFKKQLQLAAARSSREMQTVISMIFAGFEVDPAADAAQPQAGSRLESRRVVFRSDKTTESLAALGVPPPSVRQALSSTVRFLNERRLLKAE
jgi:thioester reductase-like protein